MGLERSHDAEGRRDNVDEAIGCADKEVRRAGTDTREVTLWVTVRYGMGWNKGRGLTLKIEELSSGSFTGDTSMKLNAFHCCFCQLQSISRKFRSLTDVSAISARH